MAQVKTNKEIFAECCLEIAHACEPFGYKYLKSRKCMKKQVGSFTAETRFSSSTSNLTGYYIEFNPICHMINTATGKIYWDFDLCCFRHKGKVWNVGRENTRKSSIQEITTLLQEGFLPLAEKYGTNINQVLDEAISNGWFIKNPAGTYSLDVLYLLLDFGSKEQVAQYVYKYIVALSDDGKNDFVADYNAFVAENKLASRIEFCKLIPIMLDRKIPMPL